MQRKFLTCQFGTALTLKVGTVHNEGAQHTAHLTCRVCRLYLLKCHFTEFEVGDPVLANSVLLLLCSFMDK